MLGYVELLIFVTSNILAQAVAALLQTDTSAVVTLKSSGIDRPSKLDGKTYASYGARYCAMPLCRHSTCEADILNCLKSCIGCPQHTRSLSPAARLLGCTCSALSNNSIW